MRGRTNDAAKWTISDETKVKLADSFIKLVSMQQSTRTHVLQMMCCLHPATLCAARHDTHRARTTVQLLQFNLMDMLESVPE
jgi:hypothetical protein